MKETGEWGEFFPVSMSPFAYNETVAQEYFSLTKKEALERGYKWQDPCSDAPLGRRDDVLICEATGKPYKIQKSEAAFYEKMGLPTPKFCPDERHRRRMALRNPRTLYDRTCTNCQTNIQTTYAPDRPEKVLCEKCYLQTVE